AFGLPSVLALLLSCAAPCDAQTDVAGPPTHYEGHVRVDVPTRTIEAEWDIQHTVTEDTRSGLGLLLNPAFEVLAVTGPQVASVETGTWDGFAPWTRIGVTFRPDVTVGSRVSVRVRYRGTPTPEELGFPIDRITPEWVELNIDGAWHPIFESVSEVFTAAFDLVIDPAWTVVSSGIVSRSADGFRVENTLPQIDIALVAAPDLERRRRGVFELYARGGDGRSLEALLDMGGACVAFLNERYGGTHPITAANVVVAPRDDTGYARRGFISLSRLDAHTAEGLAGYVCHELAHFWHVGAGASSPDHWLNESFAEYAAVSFVGARYGASARAALREEKERRADGQPPVWTPAATERPPHAVLYHKAPLALLDLEARIGADAMRRFVAFVFGSRPATTQTVLDGLEEIAGRDARIWFAERLAR
ncbi:MAG: hypothetical protein KC645_04575, partial [Gemmatimonadetes bacterium]|nr:hypothetical protein [Gemmatimonadota bacterium]